MHEATSTGGGDATKIVQVPRTRDKYLMLDSEGFEIV